MSESLEVGQRENDYDIIKIAKLPNLVTVRPDSSRGEGGRQDTVVRAESVWRGGGGYTQDPA